MLKKYEKISKEHKKDRQFWSKEADFQTEKKSELNKTKLAEKVTANEKLNDEDSGIITCSNQMGLTVESKNNYTSTPLRLAPAILSSV